MSLYVPDLVTAVRFYGSLGFTSQGGEASGVGSSARLVLPGVSTALALHDDARRQFVHVTLGVSALGEAYRALSLDPRVRWLELPHVEGGSREATLSGPDGNVLVLREHTP